MKRHLLTTLEFILLISLLWLPTACSRITPDTYKGRQLVLGNGGGITGASTAYYLLENGKLYTRSSRDTVFTFIGKQTGADTKRAFKTAEEDCQIKTTIFDHPGNTYKFAQWEKGEQRYRVTWGDGSRTVPPSYPQLYNSFMAMASEKQK